MTPGTAFTLNKVGTGEFAITTTDEPDLGNINVNAGRLTVTNAAALGIAADTATISSGAQLSLSTTGTLSAIKNIALQGGGILSSDGTGTVILGDGTTNTAVTLSAAALASGITANIPFTMNSQITGSGSLDKTGASIFTINGTSNNYTGGTTLTAGQTVILPTNAANAFGVSTTPITFAGGTLTANGALTFARNLSIPLSGALSEATAGSTLTIPGQVDLVNQGTLSVAGVGNVSITGNVIDDLSSGGFVNGLLEGIVSLTNGADETDPNPGTAVDPNYNGPVPFGGSVNFFRTGETSQLVGAGPWDNNQTWAYDGQIFVPTTTISGVPQSTTPVQFASQIDDDSRVTIDGVIVANQPGYGNVVTSGILNLTPGWHNIDVRFGNGGGGAGPSGNVGNAAALGGWPAGGLSANGLAPGAGFGFGIQGIAGTGQTAKPVTTAGDINGADYLDVVDAGDGLTFRHIAGGNIVMSGTGILTLSGTGNNYHGQTTVNSGTLDAASNSALGDPAGVAVVKSGGSLAIASGTALTKQTITLTGTGSAGNSGALSPLGGSASYSGTIVAGGNFTIGAAAGATLTLGGTIDLKASGITFSGAGNTVVNSSITTSLAPSTSNSVSMAGSGTATLSGTNTYIGATSVTSGILAVSSASALGSTSGVLASGGTFQMNGNFSLLTTPISITGNGAGGIGALEAIGNATVGGDQYRSAAPPSAPAPPATR